MSDFTTVAKVGAIPEGGGDSFEVNGRIVGVYLIEGTYHAIDDLCPHMGAQLSGGHVEGKVVTCPWHAWRFDVCEGTWCDNPKVGIDTFDVRVQGDDIQVRVPTEEEEAAAEDRGGGEAAPEETAAEEDAA